MERQVILLNGPSSSGKSTLAGALRELTAQRRLENYAVVSIDDFLNMSPDQAIYEDDVYFVSDDLCARALECLNAGDGVILDHVITSERIFARLRLRLSAWPIRTVRVTCSLRQLRERELARGDRCPGSAEASEAYLFPREGYDLVVDTGAKPPAENALLIFHTFF